MYAIYSYGSAELPAGTAIEDLEDGAEVEVTVRFNPVEEHVLAPDEITYVIETTDAGRAVLTYQVIDGTIADYPTGIRLVDAGPLTGDFPFAELFDYVRADIRIQTVWSLDALDDVRRAADVLHKPPRRRGRPPLGEQHFRDVAAAYARLVNDGHRQPVKDIAINRNVSHDTARRWVKEARKRGYLSPGRPGKAGWRNPGEQ